MQIFYKSFSAFILKTLLNFSIDLFVKFSYTNNIKSKRVEWFSVESKWLHASFLRKIST